MASANTHQDLSKLKDKLAKAGFDPDHLEKELLSHVLPDGEGCSEHLHNWRSCAQEIFLAKLHRLLERLEKECLYPILKDLLALCAQEGIDQLLMLPQKALNAKIESLIAYGYRDHHPVHPPPAGGGSLVVKLIYETTTRILP